MNAREGVGEGRGEVVEELRGGARVRIATPARDARAPAVDQSARRTHARARAHEAALATVVAKLAR